MRPFFMSYVRGEDRGQGVLLPSALEDYVTADGPVRVIDAFVDGLDVSGLGFGRAAPAGTGRPPYDPRDLLKLYVYGYLNEVRSSRRLERECGRNVEVMSLLRRLAPDFKTIADFRRDNGAAIVGACRAFVLFCRDQGLFRARLVALDGSKFRAAASPKRIMGRRVRLRRSRRAGSNSTAWRLRSRPKSAIRWWRESPTPARWASARDRSRRRTMCKRRWTPTRVSSSITR
jgi:transposase